MVASVPKYELTVMFDFEAGRRQVHITDLKFGYFREELDELLESRLEEYLSAKEIEAVRDTLEEMPVGRISTAEFDDIELELLVFVPKTERRYIRKQYRRAG